MRNVLTVAVLALIVCSVRPVKADTIFSNLAPGQIPGTVCCGIGGFGIEDDALAAQFVPQSTFDFTDAEIPLAFNSGTTNEAHVFLMTDSGGQPGSILDDFNIFGLPNTVFGTIFTFNSIAQPPIVLDAGTAYWLVVTPADSTSSVSWRRASTSDLITSTNFLANTTSTSPAGPWQSLPVGINPDRPAFEIDGTPVPEPSSLLLLGTGLLGLGLLGRRRVQTRTLTAIAPNV